MKTHFAQSRTYQRLEETETSSDGLIDRYNHERFVPVHKLRAVKSTSIFSSSISTFPKIINLDIEVDLGQLDLLVGR